MKQCRWVKTKLVCQVAFVEWTAVGHLRHCTFVAMRDDKKACNEYRNAEAEDANYHSIPFKMTIASDLLQRHFQTLVEDNAQWQTLIAFRSRACG